MAQAGLGIAAVAVAAFGLKAVGVLVWALGAVGREAAVTTRRVIFTSGVLRRRAFEAALGEVSAVSIRQGVLGRVLGYGVVEVGAGGRRRRMEMGGAVGFGREIEKMRAVLESGGTGLNTEAQRTQSREGRRAKA
ncbi:MAG: PH domain-containing protein [Phycisphaeraceae bacterium]|nr:PH domain-containing protein [Phycisphaeraceae bacterium]